MHFVSFVIFCYPNTPIKNMLSCLHRCEKSHVLLQQMHADVELGTPCAQSGRVELCLCLRTGADKFLFPTCCSRSDARGRGCVCVTD